MKDVRIHAVVVPEFKLIDIERKVLARDFMEGSDNVALDDTPKPFDGIGVDCAEHVLAQTVTDKAVREGIANATIALVVISREQANLVGIPLH